MNLTLQSMSSLRRGLVWTLPGAALASLPVGLVLHTVLARKMGLSSGPSLQLVLIALGALVPATLIGSSLAIHEYIQGIDRMFLRTVLVLFNVLMIMAAAGIAFTYIGTGGMSNP